MDETILSLSERGQITIPQKIRGKYLVKHFISYEDDSELRLAVNEVANHLRIHSVSFYQTAYWLLWLIKIEKFKRSNKVSFRVKRRPVENINEKYWNDWVWLLWEIILNETDYTLINIFSQHWSEYFMTHLQNLLAFLHYCYYKHDNIKVSGVMFAPSVSLLRP